MSGIVVEREPLLAPAPARHRIGVRQSLLAAGALAVGLAAAWYGDHWWTVGRFIESTDDAYVGGDTTVIAPKVAGFIAAVAVTDNQAVHAGDLLVKLDDRDFRAAVAKADAAVAAQQATLANIDARRRLQLAMIDQARAALQATGAELVRTQDDFARYRTLSQDRWASAQRFQQADADYRKAAAADAGARAALEAAEGQIDVIATQRRQAEAALAGAQADRTAALLNLGDTELRAPIDGTVGNRSAHAGEYAAIGTPLVSVVPAHGLWVDANFKEDQLAGVYAGLPATIVADVLPGEVFRGRVDSLSPATGAMFSVLPAENATGNFTKIVQLVPVRILLDGDASALGRLRPGLSVTATVDERR